MTEFSIDLKQYFFSLADDFFCELRSGEVANLSLFAENSLFLRFNQSLVRQSTQLQQIQIELKFQQNQRQCVMSLCLSGNRQRDWLDLLNVLERCRQECGVQPQDPYFTAITETESINSDRSMKLPPPSEIIDSVIEAHQGQDMASFFSGGPIVRANINSLGQKNWFSNVSFFYDYSLFTVNRDGAPKANKGTFANNEWLPIDLIGHVKKSLQQMPILQRRELSLKPGEYRCFLASAAVAEIAQLFSWNAFDYSALRQGRSSMAKLNEAGAKLSPIFNLREDLSLGLSPQFNSEGEILGDGLSIIEKGELKNWMISNRAGTEYGVSPNFFSGQFSSASIAPGNLTSAQILPTLGDGLFIGQLHYLNWSDLSSSRFTGMTRYNCFWAEKGELVAPIKDMRFDVSVFEIFGTHLLDLEDKSFLLPNTQTYSARQPGGCQTPGALLSSFSLKA